MGSSSSSSKVEGVDSPSSSSSTREKEMDSSSPPSSFFYSSSMKRVKYVVGLDFGTAYSGFGVSSVDSDGRIELINYWEDCDYNCKTRMALIMDDKLNVVSWGNTAVKKKLIEPLPPNHTFVENFKLALHKGSGISVPKGLDPVILTARYPHRNE